MKSQLMFMTLRKKGLLLTHATTDLGNWLNGKLVLYLQSQCLTESLGILNPPLLQAAKRYEISSEISR